MNLFGAKRAETIALVDVAADSVGAAVVVAREEGPAEIVFTERAPLAPREGEALDMALGRSLATAVGSLAKAGGPAALRAGSSAAPQRVVAVVGTPFEEPRVRIERLVGEKGERFTFTKAAVEQALKKSAEEVPGELLADEAVITTSLDGYETAEPWGRKAARASVTVLSSLAKEGALGEVAKALRAAYHTHALEAASSALAFSRAFVALFPHEEECIALIARGGLATLLLIEDGALRALAEAELGAEPAKGLEAAMIALAKEHPLPHSVFLVADAARREELQKALGGERFASLWLSDIPPRILPVLPEHLQLSGKVKVVGEAGADLFLGLLALFCTQPGRPTA